MSRVIKFRAWSTKVNVMTEGVSLQELIGASLGRTGVELDPENEKNVVWMQFTGLLDKNGKEIYEGDVVKRTKDKREFGEDSREIVTWTDGGFRNFYWSGSEEFIVIGNIYENPELIEKS